MAQRGPTAARRTLARVLRERREQAGLTIRQAAKRAGLDASTLSRIETAASRVEPGTALLLLEEYGVPKKDRDQLRDLSLDARKRGWWQRYSGAIPAWFQMYVGLESDASAIRTYESDLIPGFLQTYDYARAMIEDHPGSLDESEIKKRVTVRQERQQRISGEDGPPVSVVFGEVAIRRRVGDRDIMRDQLNHLVSASKWPNMSLQIMPLNVNHPGNYGSFVVLDFPGELDQAVVYTEYCGGALYLEEDSEIANYSEMFTKISALALSPEDTRALIGDAANHH